jgi:hypothetical protein
VEHCLDYSQENVGLESRLKKMMFLIPEQQRRTTHAQLVPRLRMNAALPLHLLYAFLACRGTILPFLLLYIT